jgi:3D (Asp-Asp-Asp) domain-containing protein
MILYPIAIHNTKPVSFVAGEVDVITLGLYVIIKPKGVVDVGDVTIHINTNNIILIL